VEVLAPMDPDYATILTPEALAFIANLARKFTDR
jgi:hypothetical protein